MIDTLQIQRFRGLNSFNVGGLARVNLFVGANNAGKSSILEAMELLAGGGDPRVLRLGPMRRGERIESAVDDRMPLSYDISHLFFGHELKVGNSFVIEGSNSGNFRFSCEVTPHSEETKSPALEKGGEESVDVGPLLDLKIESHLLIKPLQIPLSQSGALSFNTLRLIEPEGTGETVPIEFLSTDLSDPSLLGRYWDAIVLSPDEQRVIEALQIIEPRVERIAFSSTQRPGARVLVKLTGTDQRIPLGSMGDGLKRLLALAIRLHRATNGYLLTDEIDTGLHYSVMGKMWQLVVETAKARNIQVFATSHSLDCVNALAWLHEACPHLQNEIALHRVEPSSSTATRYGLDEIAIAARNHMEIR